MSVASRLTGTGFFLPCFGTTRENKNCGKAWITTGMTSEAISFYCRLISHHICFTARAYSEKVKAETQQQQ